MSGSNSVGKPQPRYAVVREILEEEVLVNANENRGVIEIIAEDF